MPLIPVMAPGALPGELQVDAALIDAFLQRAHAVHRRKSLEMAIEIGRAAIELFFGGDFGAFHRRGRKHASFRALVERNQLPMSASTLNRMIGVVEQVGQIDPRLAAELPFSHHCMLLPIRDVQAKNDLARRAVGEGLGKREFAMLARARVAGQGKGSNGGRRPMAPIVRVARQVEVALQMAPTTSGGPLIPGAAPADLLRVAEGLELHGRSLLRLAEQVRSQVRHR